MALGDPLTPELKNGRAVINSHPAGTTPEDNRNEEVYLALEPHVAALASAAVETG